MLAPEPQEVSTIGHALGIQSGDRAVGGDSQANGALPLHVPGRPEGQAPPSGAVPVFDEGLLGRGVVSDHVGVIGGYRNEPGGNYRTLPAQ